MRRFSAIVLAVGLAAPVVHAASFTSEAAWLGSMPTSPVTFDVDAVAPIDFSPGLNDLAELDVIVTGGATGNARINDVPNWLIAFGPAEVQTVEIVFDQPVYGIAALWSNTFMEDGFVVETPDAAYALDSISPGLNAAFIGISEATPFSSVTLRSGFLGGDDFVFFRGLQYAPVPEPTTLVLLGGMALATLRRR